jgi:hypothetical protein
VVLTSFKTVPVIASGRIAMRGRSRGEGVPSNSGATSPREALARAALSPSKPISTPSSSSSRSLALAIGLAVACFTLGYLLGNLRFPTSFRLPSHPPKSPEQAFTYLTPLPTNSSQPPFPSCNGRLKDEATSGPEKPPQSDHSALFANTRKVVEAGIDAASTAITKVWNGFDPMWFLRRHTHLLWQLYDWCDWEGQRHYYLQMRPPITDYVCAANLMKWYRF